jgi:hypothetical protein
MHYTLERLVLTCPFANDTEGASSAKGDWAYHSSNISYFWHFFKTISSPVTDNLTWDFWRQIRGPLFYLKLFATAHSLAKLA